MKKTTLVPDDQISWISIKRCIDLLNEHLSIDGEALLSAVCGEIMSIPEDISLSFNVLKCPNLASCQDGQLFFNERIVDILGRFHRDFCRVSFLIQTTYRSFVAHNQLWPLLVSGIDAEDLERFVTWRYNNLPCPHGENYDVSDCLAKARRVLGSGAVGSAVSKTKKRRERRKRAARNRANAGAHEQSNSGGSNSPGDQNKSSPPSASKEAPAPVSYAAMAIGDASVTPRDKIGDGDRMEKDRRLDPQSAPSPPASLVSTTAAPPQLGAGSAGPQVPKLVRRAMGRTVEKLVVKKGNGAAHGEGDKNAAQRRSDRRATKIKSMFQDAEAELHRAQENGGGDIASSGSGVSGEGQKAAVVVSHETRQTLSVEFDDKVVSMLRALDQADSRLRAKNPVKARLHRHVVSGMREVINNTSNLNPGIRCVVAAADVKPQSAHDPKKVAFAAIVDRFRRADIPVFFVSSRKSLGRIHEAEHRHNHTCSIAAVLRTNEAAHKQYTELLQIWGGLREQSDE